MDFYLFTTPRLIASLCLKATRLVLIWHFKSVHRTPEIASVIVSETNLTAVLLTLKNSRFLFTLNPHRSFFFFKFHLIPTILKMHNLIRARADHFEGPLFPRCS